LVEDPEGKGTLRVSVEDPEGEGTLRVLVEDPEGEGTLRVLVEEPEGKGTLRKPRQSWQANINATLILGWNGVDWFHVARHKES
jgi:hypothetical protein